MCKVRGVGVDLCAIERMKNLLTDERFLSRYFTEGEAVYIRGKGRAAAQSMAGIFAAKEATVKAFGVGLSIPLKSIEVIHASTGQPLLRITGQAAEKCGTGKLHLSISHEGNMAVAFVVWHDGDETADAPSAETT